MIWLAAIADDFYKWAICLTLSKSNNILQHDLIHCYHG